MKEASIEIETFDTFTLAKDFIRENKLSVGSEIEISRGIFFRVEGIRLREAALIPQIVQLVLIITKDIAVPIALGIASNWLYDVIKKGKAEKIRIEGNETQISKDKIEKMLRKEIKERPPRKEYIVSLSFPDFSQDEIKLGARTLSHQPIIFNGNELPYPDNMAFFADYVSGNVEVTIYIRDAKINELYEKGRPLYATAQIDEKYLPRLFFTSLILSSKAVPSSCRIKKI